MLLVRKFVVVTGVSCCGCNGDVELMNAVAVGDDDNFVMLPL